MVEEEVVEGECVRPESGGEEVLGHVEADEQREVDTEWQRRGDEEDHDRHEGEGGTEEEASERSAAAAVGVGKLHPRDRAAVLPQQGISKALGGHSVVSTGFHTGRVKKSSPARPEPPERNARVRF